MMMINSGTNYNNSNRSAKNTSIAYKPRFFSFAIIAIALLLSIAATSLLHGVYAKDYDTRISEGSDAIPLSNKDSGQMTEPMIRTESSMTVDPTPTPSGTRSNEQTTLPTVTFEKTSSPSVMNLDGDFSTQAALQIPRTFQSTDIVSSTGIYEVTFITSTAGAIDKIEIAFPAGTNIGAAGVVEKVGIGGGTLTKVGSTLTYDVTTPVNIPAGTFIRLEISGIKNPSNPSTTFTASITTRDSGGAVIDGPSPTNVYTIKKIGTNDIAPGAIVPRGTQRPSSLFDVPPNSPLQVTSPPCLPTETIQAGGFGSDNTNGLLNIVAEFAVDTNADGSNDSWRIGAFNLDTTNTWKVQSIAECGSAAP
jgi:hypothetical protein